MLQQNHKKKMEVQSSNINKTKIKREHNFKVVAPTHQKNNKTHKKGKALISCCPYPSTKPQRLRSFNHFWIFNYLLVHLVIKYWNGHSSHITNHKEAQKNFWVTTYPHNTLKTWPKSIKVQVYFKKILFFNEFLVFFNHNAFMCGKLIQVFSLVPSCPK